MHVTKKKPALVSTYPSLPQFLNYSLINIVAKHILTRKNTKKDKSSKKAKNQSRSFFSTRITVDQILYLDDTLKPTQTYSVN